MSPDEKVIELTEEEKGFDETRNDIEEHVSAYVADEEEAKRIVEEAMAAIAEGKQKFPKRTIFLVKIPDNQFPFVCRTGSFSESIRFASALEKMKSGAAMEMNAATFVAKHVLSPKLTVDNVINGSDQIKDGDGIRLFSAIMKKSGGGDETEIKNV
jgi:hypothetical protein